MPHAGLHPLPTDPLPAVRSLLAYFRKDEGVDLVEVGHAAWHLAGYAYGMIDPHVAESLGTVALSSDAATVEMLERLESGVGTGFGSIDWLSLAITLIELLAGLLRKG